MYAVNGSGLANRIAPVQWKTLYGETEGFPQQTTADCCSVFILMYALGLCIDAPLFFIETDLPCIRKWWSISLMERFHTEGHGQRFAYWTSEAKKLLQGSLEPVYRVPKARKTQHDVSVNLVTLKHPSHTLS